MFAPSRHALTFCPACSLTGPSPISRCLPAPDADGGQRCRRRCRRGRRPAMAARTPPAMPPPTPSTPTPPTDTAAPTPAADAGLPKPIADVPTTPSPAWRASPRAGGGPTGGAAHACDARVRCMMAAVSGRASSNLAGKLASEVAAVAGRGSCGDTCGGAPGAQ